MARQLERCVEHARKRKQFGKPIGKFQAVANRIVEMKLRLETCRPLVYQIGWLKEQGKDATMEAALAKLHVSDCFVKNSLDAVQVFGASGFVTETGIERDPPRQRRQPDLFRDQRHPAQHHRPGAGALMPFDFGSIGIPGWWPRIVPRGRVGPTSVGPETAGIPRISGPTEVGPTHHS